MIKHCSPHPIPSAGDVYAGTQSAEFANETLSRRAGRGVVWLVGSRAWSQILTLTIGVALARMLAPGDYGLLGMVTVLTGLLGRLSDLGLNTVVIQKQDLTSKDLSTVFWFNLGLASVVALLVVACSPLAARFYSQPKVVPVMCALALSFPISSLASVQYALLQKDMRFGDLTKIHVAGSLAAGILALLAAWVGAKVWALVLQTLALSLFAVVGLWIRSSWRPVRRFAAGDLRRVWSFSLNLTGHSLANYFARNADNFLVGRFLGAAQLGLYTLAYNLMVYPVANLSSVAQSVLIPAMSQVQHEPQRVANAFIRACRVMSFLVFPAMLGLALVAREAVVSIYGPKWDEAGKILQILCWVGIFQPFDSLTGTLFVARGFTGWFFWCGLVSSIITVAGFVIGLHWGLLGIAWSYLTSQMLLAFIGLPIQYRKLEVSLRRLLGGIAIPALAAAGMGAIVLITRTALYKTGLTPPIAVLTVCVSVGSLTYASLLFLLRKLFWNDLKAEFLRVFGRTG